MSQTKPYPHAIKFPTHEDLRAALDHLMDESPTHDHNVEVWADELTLWMNESGLECVERMLSEPRLSLGLDVARARRLGYALRVFMNERQAVPHVMSPAEEALIAVLGSDRFGATRSQDQARMGRSGTETEDGS